jgi:TM2 domain-containing membrane protein YozV
MRNEYVNHIYNMFQSYIPEDERSLFKSALEYAPDDRFEKLLLVKVYDPTAVVLISVFGGGFGADRFYIGDIGLGLLKLFFGPIVAILCAIATGVLTGMSESMALEQILQISAIISLVSIAAAVITGLWWLIDCFCSYKKAKKKNLQNILNYGMLWVTAEIQV